MIININLLFFIKWFQKLSSLKNEQERHVKSFTWIDKFICILFKNDIKSALHEVLAILYFLKKYN